MTCWGGGKKCCFLHQILSPKVQFEGRMLGNDPGWKFYSILWLLLRIPIVFLFRNYWSPFPDVFSKGLGRSWYLSSRLKKKKNNLFLSPWGVIFGSLKFKTNSSLERSNNCYARRLIGATGTHRSGSDYSFQQQP